MADLTDKTFMLTSTPAQVTGSADEEPVLLTGCFTVVEQTDAGVVLTDPISGSNVVVTSDDLDATGTEATVLTESVSVKRPIADGVFISLEITSDGEWIVELVRDAE